jgi:hypothetical protein
MEWRALKNATRDKSVRVLLSWNFYNSQVTGGGRNLCNKGTKQGEITDGQGSPP